LVPPAVKEKVPEAAFSVKQFFHCLWELPMPEQPSESIRSEDLIFAFQEKLCSIIEIEIESDDGKRSAVFPSKLNCYLADEITPTPECDAAGELANEAPFNVTVQDLTSSVDVDDQEPPNSLSTALIRVDSDDSI
jgi:hypothetical protein